MLTSQQQRVLDLHNQLRMTPESFSRYWEADAAILAAICGVSKSTTAHWLGGRTSQRTPKISHQRLLAVAHFLLIHAVQIQPLLERWHQLSNEALSD